MKRVVKMYFAATTIAIKVTRKVKAELGVRSRMLLHIASVMPARPRITSIYVTVAYGCEWPASSTWNRGESPPDRVSWPNQASAGVNAPGP